MINSPGENPDTKVALLVFAKTHTCISTSAATLGTVSNLHTTAQLVTSLHNIIPPVLVDLLKSNIKGLLKHGRCLCPEI